MVISISARGPPTTTRRLSMRLDGRVTREGAAILTHQHQAAFVDGVNS